MISSGEKRGMVNSSRCYTKEARQEQEVTSCAQIKSRTSAKRDWLFISTEAWRSVRGGGTRCYQCMLRANIICSQSSNRARRREDSICSNKCAHTGNGKGKKGQNGTRAGNQPKYARKHTQQEALA